MKAESAFRSIRTFQWDLLQRVFGTSHSSIIGFVATQWLLTGESRSVIDAPPKVDLPGGRRHADLLLYQDDESGIAVEVEAAGAHNAERKFEALAAYVRDERLAISGGLLVAVEYHPLQAGLDQLLERSRVPLAAVRILRTAWPPPAESGTPLEQVRRDTGHGWYRYDNTRAEMRTFNVAGSAGKWQRLWSAEEGTNYSGKV
jgi:hypothetical protein